MKKILSFAIGILLSAGSLYAQTASYVQLPPNSTGVKLQGWTNSVSSNTVMTQAFTPTGSNGATIGIVTSPIFVRFTDGAAAYDVAKSAQLPAALDGSGFLKVHEQGTGNVNVQNSSIPVTQSGAWSMNVSQVNGTTADTNSGSKSAGTLRVVLATDQPQLTNALKVDGSAVTQPVSNATAANLKAQTAAVASVSTSGTLQSAAVANGNGSTLSVDGMSAAILTVNCSSCSGGTTVNFEASEDSSNYTAVPAVQVGTATIGTSVATAGVTVWEVPIGGFVLLRARISGYSAGTVTVTGHVVPVSYAPKVVNANNYFGGSPAAASSGTTNAQTQRVVLATDQPQLTNKLLVTPDANSSVNVGQVAGTTTATNSGTASAGTQRVVIATDQPAFTTPVPFNFSQVAGSALATAATGIPKVGITGSTGTAVDQGTAGVIDVNVKNWNNAASLNTASVGSNVVAFTAKRTGTTLLAPNYYAAHITTKTTTTPTASTAYISSITICVSGAGTSWSISVQNKEATPKIYYTVSSVALGTTTFNFTEPILATSGIDIVTAGTTAGTMDVFITYWQ
ncbi:MAG TPA: hypothetical protein VHU41_03380 [Thermoanaerobaculia bacterium]|jgi:hypothetical protein|nr:hypothetical protein [Thermoanaerobaculia bacterium]